MKRLLLAVLLLWSSSALAQPILRNSLTTNTLGTNLVWEPLDLLTIAHNQGSFQVTSNGITVASISAIPGANVLPRLDVFGYLRLSQQTNQLSMGGGQLLLDGSPIGGGDTVWTNDAGTVSVIGQTNSAGDPLAEFVFSGDYSQLTLRGDDSFIIVDATNSFDFSIPQMANKFDLFVDNTFASFLFYNDGGNLTLLNPAEAPTNTPYIFNTLITHTNGNLAEFKNNATNKFAVDFNGFVSMQGQTNLIGDNGTALTYNGVPIGGVTNNFTVAKGGHLTITNSITIQTNGNLILSLTKPSVLVLATNNVVTNATLSGLTLSDANVLTATGGSGGVSTAVTPLAYSGTNITGFDCLTNNMTYTLTLTNHCLFGTSTFSNVPNTTTNHFFTLALKQDSTGTWVPKFTNSIVMWSEGVQAVITTNANSVSYVYFHTHLFTNGMLVASPNLNVK